MPADLLATLVYIQTHLDGDLSLSALAGRSGRSQSHFHRLFRSLTGETPKVYTQRLRLECAALRLCLHQTSVLETALEVGFQSHETFTRAFCRQFGVLPSEVRRGGLSVLRSVTSRPPPQKRSESSAAYRLSAISLVTLKPLDLAFVRHLGAYEQVGDSVWTELNGWAERTEFEGPRVFLGIGHDAPGITPADKLRFDAALCVERPFRGAGSVGYQRLEGGRYAVATHVGHYSTLAEAHGRLFQRITRMKDVRPKGLPVIEMYHEATIDLDFDLNHTDIYLPVVPASSRLGMET